MRKRRTTMFPIAVSPARLADCLDGIAPSVTAEAIKNDLLPCYRKGTKRRVRRATLADAVRLGTFPSSMANPRVSAAASLAAWSLLHGLTMLATDDYLGPSADVETLIDSLSVCAGRYVAAFVVNSAWP